MTQKDFMPPNGETTRNGRSEQGLLDEAKHAASHLAHEAKDEASSRVASQKDRAAKSLSSVADALRGTRHELDDSIPAIGEYADKAADTVQQLSDYIRSKNIGEIIDTVEHFARRESALFLGGAAAVGLLAGRFLRSSRPANAGGSYAREGRDFGGSTNDRNRAYERAGYDRSYGSDANRPMGGRIGGGMSGSAYSNTGDMNRSSSMGSSGASKSSTSNSSSSSSMGGSSIGVQKVGTSSPPAGQAAQREVTKPGGFTPSASKPQSTPAPAPPTHGGSTTGFSPSAGQSPSPDGAGARPTTGSNMPPKTGSEVK